ncbi:MAG: CIA30 family protein [Fibrobacter sp.]|nr:CIA30 family protein [Fibrobacter sp.]
MLQLRFPKLLALSALALGLFSATFASDITPLRTGPVSQYGQLQAGTNNAGEGRIYGSCEHFRSSGNEVQVKGMSLFWSCAANQQRYWKKDIITGLVERQNIQLIRAAMAVDDMGEWADGHYFTKPVFYQAMLDEAVEAAIENDIYVIIDFHSHVAADSVENAKSFFRIQAEKWGKYDNVIFEVFNEPICASGSVGDNSDCSEYGGFIGMAAIKAYADQVVSVIREYSDNLIIVGTPMWDQYPNVVVDYPVEDPLERDNIAYAFHFYAGRDDGTKAHEFSLTSNANFAMQKGLSVFVSEWGTVGYDGGGAPSATLNPQWQTWMDSRKISSANWNVGKSGDPSSEAGSEYFGFDFDPDNAPDNWTYSLSGQWVNANVFNDLPATYTACDDYVPASSSSFGSSSSGNALAYDVSPNYTYVYAGGGWTIANEEGEYDLVAEVIDEETGKSVIGLKGVVAENENGWAGIGMNVGDLDGCQLLQYDYKGLSHNLALANTPDGDDVIAKYGIPATDAWETFTLDMSALSGIDLQSGLDIKWQLAGTGNGNLYVNNVRCAVPSSSSSSGDEPASSSSIKLPVVAAPTTNTELFDDFEDGDYMPLWEGVGNFWAETDVVGGGGSSNAELSFVKGSASAKALQMSYSLDVGDYPWGPPYATISTNDFNEMNLSQCSEVRYDYKGSAHKFRLKVSSTMNNLLDMGWGFPTFAVTSPSDSWQTVTIPVASLAQEWTGSSGNWVDVETVLQYANGFDWRVDGEDTDDKSSGTLAIDNIRCVGLAETQYYTITFKNGDEDYEVKSWAAGSNVPDPAGVPAKAADAQFTYTFSNWTYGSDGYGNPTRYVTGTATYEAVYNTVLRAYTVSFLMDDGTPVENGVLEGVKYGTLVSSIVPADPTKESTAEYTYAFTGWTPDIADATVTGDIDYTAVFSENKNKYAVTFVDEDESILKAAVEYDYGTLPGAIDVPTVEDKNGKKFAGWEPGLATVTKEVTYKAVYTDKIVITWKDDDGSVLRQDYVDDGDMPDYGEAPAKESTAEFTYTFDKWTPTLVAATEDATYTASYTSVKNKYDVTFVAEYNSNMDKTVSVEYGTLVNSVAPLITGAWTIEWNYEFDGWVPAITDETIVTGEATYTAKYKVTKNRYTVTFVMDDGIEKAADDVTVDYGTSIASIIPSTDPVKQATVARTYEFDRWVVNVSDTQDRELVNGEVLEGNMTLKAVFKEFPRKYGITFLNEDNSVYKAQVLYEYGTLASEILPEENPTKDSDDKFSYTFANWDPQVTDVTGEAVYRPVFTSTALAPESSSSSAEGPESSSSEEPIESSSSETPVVSSSSEDPEVSSSSEGPVVSSSSETVVASSSSEKPVSSSSTEIAANSSSSTSAPLSSSRNDDEKSSSSSADKTDGLYPTVGSVNMVFAHNELTVTVPKASEVKVQVFDMQGHLQEHYLGYSAGDHVVSLRHLNKGVYIVRVASGSAVKTQRIMIK